MKIKIIEVQDKKELKQFINLPVDIYKNDQNWVNTISLIDKKIFTDIGYNNYKLFLAFKNDRLAGRLAAFVDDNKSMVSTIKHLDAKVFRKYKIFRKNI